MYKLNCCVAVAGASVLLILAGSASGEVIGLKTVKKFVDPAEIAADVNIPGVTSLLVVNVYAEFTPGDAAAEALAVGGSAALGIALQINARDGTFFQHPFGAASQLSASAALADMPGFNTLRHDSFITIGRKLDDDPVFGADQTQIIGIDPGGWTTTQLTGSNEFAWFIAGRPRQGTPGQEPDNPLDQVLIGQYTVANPGADGGVFGQMFVFGFHTNAQGVVETFTITGVIPGPDINDDGIVNAADLTLLVESWGDCPGQPEFCSGDFDLDSAVAVPDLLTLLWAWGPVP